MMKLLRFGNYVVLLMMLWGTQVLAQTTISGKVSDEKGEPIPGATILVKGTSTGTITNVEGDYQLSVPENAVIVFSFLGFKSKEVTTGSKTIHNVTLLTDVSNLDEIIVVGFATKDRRDITGAVNSVKMDDVLGSRPVTDAAKALQGSIPGLQITYGSGQPGSGTNINIRGMNSINGGSPLVLVNNVPMDLDDVNPKDIETVTVLKDAASASIYGARAAFGVILIKTKGGGRNQPNKLEYSTTLGWNKPISLPEKASIGNFVQALKDWGQTNYWTGQNVDTWIQMINEYNTNPASHPGAIGFDKNKLRYELGNTDLYGKFLGKAGFQQVHNLAYSGGSEKAAYRVSVGYNDEDGIMNGANDTYKRYNVSMDLSTDITPKLTTTFNAMYKNGLQRNPFSGGDFFYTAINLHAASPVGTTDMYGDPLPFGSPDYLSANSPVRQNFEETIRLFGKASYKVIDGLVVNGELTYEKSNDKVENPIYDLVYVDPTTLNIKNYNPATSSYFQASNESNYFAINLYSQFNKKIKEHDFGLLVGANQENKSFKGFSASRKELISSDIPGLTTATGAISVNQNYSDFGVVGFFGRFNYALLDKYLLEINGRYDGSSRFPVGNRFGFFPSASAGWKVTNESFMQPLNPILSNLKLRASFGEIGNQNVSNYGFLPTMDAYTPDWINSSTGVRSITLNTPGLVSAGFTWERVRTLNFGVDMGLFNDRLTTIFDIYNRKTLDMLAAGAELPKVLGAAAPTENVADLSTKGWELDISWRDRINDLKYRIGFNLYNSKSVITRFKNEEGLLGQRYTGQVEGEIWGYETQGYYTQSDFIDGSLKPDLTGGKLKDGVSAFKGDSPNPGDIKYQDLNGDGVIFSGNNTLANSGDYKVIGNSTRRLQFGFNGSVEYKDFDLNIFCQGVGKRDVWQNNPVVFPYTFEFTTIYQHQLDYWTPENSNGFYPRNYPNGAGNYGNNRRVQTKYLLDGSYLRVKNITLGYSLPSYLSKKVKINKLRVFVSGENLWTMTSLPTGIDAEFSVINNGGTYPFLKNYSAGINLTF